MLNSEIMSNWSWTLLKMTRPASWDSYLVSVYTNSRETLTKIKLGKVAVNNYQIWLPGAQASDFEQCSVDSVIICPTSQE